MGSWTDFIFGKKALKKASGEDDGPTPPPAAPANLDIAKMAQDTADKNKLQGTGPSVPPATTDTKKKKIAY